MSRQLTNYSYLAYSVPVITTHWLMAPVNILQGIYAKHHGLSLAVIASVLLFSRFFDAISDPIIGYYADRHYQNHGSYQRYIVFGGMLFLPCSYFLYAPPLQVDVVYFAVTLSMFYLSWTLFELPHMAWASKFARTSDEKARAYGFRSFSGYLGLLAFYTIPLLPIFETRSITPETLEFSVIVASILTIPLLAICYKNGALKYRSSSANVTHRIPREVKKETSFFKFVASLRKNKPLLIFVGAYLMIIFSSGMWYSLIFLYVDTYLNLGEKFAQIFLLAILIGVIATPIWFRVAILIGKKKSWAITAFLLTFSAIYTGSLSPQNANFLDLVLLKVTQTLGFTCLGVIGPTMLSEIIDYSHWKYRTKDSATYFAIHTFMYKSGLAVAVAFGLAIAGWFGFDATVQKQSATSIYGLTLAIAWLPAFFAIISWLLILISPIDERRHGIVRRRLDIQAK